VPLSEHEQRLFEQIERSLAEDAKFASAVRSTDPRFHARRRVVFAVIAVLLGLAVLIYGVAIQIALLGVAGFVIMLGAAAFGIQAFRRGRAPDLKLVGGSSGPARRGRGGRGGIVSRLEDRWRNRPEGDQTG
jgi:Flp pilus assembly protein TadB